MHGARVIATAGSDAKLRPPARAGRRGHQLPHPGLRRRGQGADRRARRRRGDRARGRRNLLRQRPAAASGGHIVTCGATAGPKPTIDLRYVFFRQTSILGWTMGSKGDLLEVLGHVAAGRLRPVVDRVMSLSQGRRRTGCSRRARCSASWCWSRCGEPSGQKARRGLADVPVAVTAGCTRGGVAVIVSRARSKQLTPRQPVRRRSWLHHRSKPGAASSAGFASRAPRWRRIAAVARSRRASSLEQECVSAHRH